MTAFDRAWGVVKAPIVYHGGTKLEGELKEPVFMTSDREGAEWYADNRGNDNPEIQTIDLTPFAKPASMEDMQDIAREMGFERLEDWGEQYEDPDVRYERVYDIVSEHSPYDGTNPLDLAYVPAIREALKERGFDGIMDDDVLENKYIPTFVPLDRSQYKIKESTPYVSWTESLSDDEKRRMIESNYATDEERERWGL